MKNYLAIASKHLAAHKKNTRLAIISVMVSVALVTTIFSMLEVFWKFEKQQIINDFGSYHIIIKNVTDDEVTAVTGRIDIDTASRFMEFGGATMNGIPIEIATGECIDLIYSSQFRILSGSIPKTPNEIAVEQWAADSYTLHIGDTVIIASKNGTRNRFRISGICTDFSGTKAERIPGVLVTIGGALIIEPNEDISLIVQFKDHVPIPQAVQEIARRLNISDDRIARNERLLAMTGQSVNSTVLGLYGTGIVLFVLVLIAGVTMIYNTFNISVTDRIRQFGLFRCIGTSRKQIRALVRKEARIIALKAIPPGIVIGILITITCSAILKYFNSSIFFDIPLLSLNGIGVGAGVTIGILTVFFASLSPARKASRVSPVSAISDICGTNGTSKDRNGILSGLVPAEAALGIRNATAKKKTLFLMSSSIAISIILFLGFQVFVDFLHAGMKVNKPYTADITLVSENGLDNGLYKRLSLLEGVKRVYGRRFGYVEATFDASRLTDLYKREIGDVPVGADGSFVAPESSALISYDKNQLAWAKADLLEGTLSEGKLNTNNGIVAVALNTRKGVSIETVKFKLGDKVRIKTISGDKEYTVMAIVRSVPFANDTHLNLTTFITTEKLYTEITGDTTLDVIDIQLKSGDRTHTALEIKGMIDDKVKFYDSRQRNGEITQAFLTAAIFVYGFVFVIALISILNIANTMQTSVSAKTRYLGVMRAVGMSGRQLNRMVLCEAGTYSITGCAFGVILGLVLQKLLITRFLSDAHMTWRPSVMQVAIILILVLFITYLSVIGPLKKIKGMRISENIGALL